MLRSTFLSGVAFCWLAGSAVWGTAEARGQSSPPASSTQSIDSAALPKQTAETPAADLPGDRLDSTAMPADADKSALASPVPVSAGGLSLRLGTPLTVVLAQPVSSGVQHNGQTVKGRLAAPVRTTNGTVLPRGSAVEATVVSAAQAGMIASGGVLSLQLTHVGHIPVVTDVAEFNGAEGHKDVADSAPAKGAEALVASGTVLHFKVLQMGHVPGVVPGVAPAQTAGAAHGGNQQTGNQPGAPAPGTAQPSTAPGVSQRSVPGATTGVVPQGAPR